MTTRSTTSISPRTTKTPQLRRPSLNCTNKGPDASHPAPRVYPAGAR
ncbi:hypothetical protein ACFPRL_29845 [Pseudoclavibacter helvolus]